jgi:class 3 adenylate cyclase
MDVADPDDERLLARLRALGADESELREAAATGRAGGLALELAIRPAGRLLPFGAAVAELGVDPAEAARVWRAFGFADPTDDPDLRLAPDEVRALGLLAAGAGSTLGADSTVGLARVVGATTVRLAEAIVDEFRSEFEHPRRAGGTPYSEVVGEYVELAAVLLPSFVELLGAVLRRHLVEAAESTWEHDESPTTRRSVAVGFCDLVGYTALTGRASPAELTDLVTRFEVVAGEVASRHGGRVVKLIGDAAMFVCDDATSGLAVALDLVEAMAAEPGLPAARAALAHGTVVTRHGDYYGTVVNLAARLLSGALPGTVVAAGAVADTGELPPGVAVEPLPDQVLKGFDQPERAVRAFRV